jgi:CheY-like chemotaxis protein
MILVLCTDLLFGSKIAETARTLEVLCSTARDVSSLVAKARALPTPPQLIIVDLVLRDQDSLAALALLRQDPATALVPLVAFVPHVMEDLAAAAAATGARVMTRGQLTRKLPELLGGLA